MKRCPQVSPSQTGHPARRRRRIGGCIPSLCPKCRSRLLGGPEEPPEEIFARNEYLEIIRKEIRNVSNAVHQRILRRVYYAMETTEEIQENLNVSLGDIKRAYEHLDVLVQRRTAPPRLQIH